MSDEQLAMSMKKQLVIINSTAMGHCSRRVGTAHPTKEVNDKKPDLHKGGFTLLEVMVALLIIATSFVTLLHTRNQSVTAADYAKRATVAALLASERMSDIEHGDFPDTGEDSSNFGDDYPEYRWKTSVSDTAYENIREVKVDVLWGEASSGRSVGLVSYVRKKEQP